MPSAPQDRSFVERFDGHQMAEYLQRHPTVLYRYRGNVPGFVVLLVMAGAAVGVAGYIWVDASPHSPWHWTMMSVLSAFALASLSLVVYWWHYTRVRYLATSDRHLIIGNGSKVVALPWNRLDEESLAFTNDVDGEPRGLLELHVGGERFKVRIFSRYAVLRNLHAFIAAVLTRLQ